MTGDSIRKLLLGAALAVDRQIRRLILKLADSGHQDGTGEDKRPDGAGGSGDQAALPAQEIRQAAGPPKHWVDRVRKYAPELLAPQVPQYFSHGLDAGERRENSGPGERLAHGENARPGQAVDRRQGVEIRGAGKGCVMADRRELPAADAGDTQESDAAKGRPSGKARMDDPALPGDFSEAGRRRPSRRVDAGAEIPAGKSPSFPGKAAAASAGQRRRHITDLSTDSASVPDAASISRRRPVIGAPAFSKNPPNTGAVRPGAPLPVRRPLDGRRDVAREEIAAAPLLPSSDRRDAGPFADDAAGRFRSPAPEAPSERAPRAATAAKPSVLYPGPYENGAPGEHALDSRRPAAMIPDVDEGFSDAADRRWPSLPDEDPPVPTSGAGRWPLLLDEKPIKGALQADRAGRWERAADMRKNERLRRLENEQAGSVWNEWPF